MIFFGYNYNHGNGINNQYDSISNKLSKRFSHSSSRIKLFDNYSDITSEVINDLVKNQKVSISEADLYELKKIPGVKFGACAAIKRPNLPSFNCISGKIWV